MARRDRKLAGQTMPNIKVFLSRSGEKCFDPATSAELLSRVREALARRGWRVVDPLVESQSGSVSLKVETSLLEADVVIADCGATSPNIVYEVGFARALNKPVLALLNRDYFDDQRFAEYFALIGQGRRHPLPADLGDLEYCEYSATSVARGGELERRLEEHLSHLALTLSPGTRTLNAALCKVRTSSLLARQKSGLVADPPLLRFLGGWLDQISRELTAKADHSFEIDSDYYRSCFKEFDTADRSRVLAIADLSDPTEKFWMSDGVALPVSKRIFLVRSLDLFDDQKLATLHAALVSHVTRVNDTNYAVFVGRSDHPRHPAPRPGWLARHLLLIAPDLVGGYVRKNDSTLLRIQCDRAAYADGLEHFHAIEQQSIPFRSQWSIDDLRNALLMLDRIGIWQESWDRVEDRDDSYFAHYDLHIRRWIPGYDELLAEAAAAVDRFLPRGADVTKDIRLLEVGCGTGALTLGVAKHLAAKQDGLACRYWATDMSERMLRELERRLSGVRYPAHLQVRREKATAWDGLPAAIEDEGPFDVICGSLILHDTFSHQVVGDLPRMLRRCFDLLRPGGYMIFADSFFDEERVQRHLDYWRRWMVKRGLSSEDVQRFFDCNMDMVQTPNLRVLTGQAVGFERPRLRGVPGSDQDSPFRILVMRKASAEASPRLGSDSGVSGATATVLDQQS
jgi:SAM-dependent methyltransferase